MLVIDFAFVQGKYTDGYWTKEQVAGAVKMKKITAEEYQTITGDVYVVPTI